jgi:4-amino-4-deoxy-L-arabinose transferase-like glycosyltransferase
MATVPIAAQQTPKPARKISARESDARFWARIGAASSLAAAGVLLMTGKSRTGLALAAAGTVLAAWDQQETVRECWRQLPVMLEEVQGVLGRAQKAVDDISFQGERIRKVLEK